MHAFDLTTLWPHTALEQLVIEMDEAPCGPVSALAFDESGERLVASVGPVVLVLDRDAQRLISSVVTNSEEVTAEELDPGDVEQAEDVDAEGLFPGLYAHRLHVSRGAEYVAVEWVGDPSPGNMVSRFGVIYDMTRRRRIHRTNPYDGYGVDALDGMSMCHHNEHVIVEVTRSDVPMTERVDLRSGEVRPARAPEAQQTPTPPQPRLSLLWTSADGQWRGWSHRDAFHKDWGDYGGLVPVGREVILERTDIGDVIHLSPPAPLPWPSPFACHKAMGRVAWAVGAQIVIDTIG
ncbi:MAG: hypothetical protein ACE366_08375 [Bradymonadia bacterium]